MFEKSKKNKNLWEEGKKLFHLSCARAADDVEVGDNLGDENPSVSCARNLQESRSDQNNKRKKKKKIFKSLFSFFLN